MSKRLTQDEFNKLILKKFKGKIIHTGEYINTLTRTSFKCLECNYGWEAKPNSIKYSKGCPKCNGTRKLTKEDFDKRLNSVFKGKIISIGTYIDTQTKTRVKCLKCNYDWEAKPSNLFLGRGCPKCAGKMKISEKEFKEKLRRLHNEKIILIGPYKNIDKKTEFECLVCGYKWETSPTSVVNWRTGCAKCKGLVTLSPEEAKQKVFEVSNGKVAMIGLYKNSHSLTSFKCNVCNYRWKATLSNILRGTGCPRCSHGYTPSEKEVVEMINKKHQGKIVMTGKYSNLTTKTLFRCKKCGYEWFTKPTYIHRGRGCPICKISHGERDIKRILKMENIEFIPQFKMKCNKVTYRYDFFLPKLNLLIEFDGPQHFKKTDFFKDSLKVIKKRDKIKDKLAVTKGYKLLRIGYSELKNIEKVVEYILNDELNGINHIGREYEN